MMFNKKKQLSPTDKGNIGEKYVAKYLRRRWFRIRERNMRNWVSEIDIIAEKKDLIVFVEVKSRTVGQFIRPAEAVNKQKQRKILRAAEKYIRDKGITKQIRFDIAEVYLKKDSCKVDSMNYIENAFS